MTVSPEQQRPASRPVAGIAASLVGVAVLTAFAAEVPTAARKLLLFPLLFGLGCGGIALWSACEFGLSRRTATMLVMPLIVMGLVFIAVRGHRQLCAEQAAAWKSDPQRKMAARMLEAAASQAPAFAAASPAQPLLAPSFSEYLALRVRPLGEWRTPWPLLAWGAELLVAASAGAWLVSRQLRARSGPTQVQP